MTLTDTERNLLLASKPGRRNLLNPTQQQEVVRQFLAGVNQKVLAEKYGVSRSTIQKTIRDEKKRLLSEDEEIS